MYHKKIYIAHLIAKYMAEDLSSKEETDLDAWRNESVHNETLFKRIISEQNISLFYKEYTQVNSALAWKQFEAKRKFRKRKKQFMRALAFAAVILLPVCVGLFTLVDLPSSLPPSGHFVANEINPGEYKAILKLSTGDTRSLTDKDTLEFDKKSPVLDSLNTLPTEGIPKTNEIKTARGGEYQLVLSDGTKVYLNAMSSLSFPDEFTVEERRVSLEGEAYFEVAKSSIPFIVTTDYADVHVLGTKFNVSAYKNEPYQAALLEGSIVIATQSDEQLLEPSQGVTISEKGADMRIEEIDALSISAWYEGKIIFKDKPLEFMMKTLARWYDFEFVFSREALKNLRFSCAVNKYDNIGDFIALLESTQKIKAEIKNQIIYLK